MEKTAFEIGFEKAASKMTNAAINLIKSDMGVVKQKFQGELASAATKAKPVVQGVAEGVKKVQQAAPAMGKTVSGGLGVEAFRQSAKADLSHSTSKHMPLFKV